MHKLIAIACFCMGSCGAMDAELCLEISSSELHPRSAHRSIYSLQLECIIHTTYSTLAAPTQTIPTYYCSSRSHASPTTADIHRKYLT
ncbi:hypothetical protein DFH27DRAFT_566291 [Peziza echinospora]|nr:hypothetical protein DFH27DRAFT_566291 [Peziza echinospora]